MDGDEVTIILVQISGNRSNSYGSMLFMFMLFNHSYQLVAMSKEVFFGTKFDED